MPEGSCEGAGTAERSYPISEVRGGSQEELPHVQEAVAARVQEDLEELLHVQGQETPLIQGKEQRLRFAGAAVKRYPTSKVRELTLLLLLLSHFSSVRLCVTP